MTTLGGGPHEPTTSPEKPPGSADLARWFDEFVAAREDSRSITWWSMFLQSWAPSTLDVYERDTCGTSSSDRPSLEYLLELYHTQLTSAVLATAFCLRISESASIRVQDLDLTAATMSYYDKKTPRCWITRPASTYVIRLMGFARAAALRLGRKPFQPLVKGGATALSATLVKLLGEGQYDHLRWHCWRRLGATLLIRHGATVQELLA